MIGRGNSSNYRSAINLGGFKMEKEQIELLGAAFLAGYKLERDGELRTAPAYERPQMVHKVPRQMIRLDGDRCQPSIVQRFDGKPLYYILDRTAFESGEVSVFTRPEYAQQFRGGTVKASENASSADKETRVVSSQALTSGVKLGGYVVLHERINYGGAGWLFWASWGNIPDFRSVYPTLWWSTNINDRVSSVDTNIKANPVGVKPWTVLYQHINFQGAQLWISNDDVQFFQEGPGLVRDLQLIGFNDVASSMSYEA
jgi:hypothetical protein